MIFLYRLLFIPALLLALPVYVPRMLRRGGYGRHFWQRFGLWGSLPLTHPEARRVWIHAVSVGEVLALKPLIRMMTGRDDRMEIVLSATTSTAYALAARELAPDLRHLAYFPLDFWPFSRSVWEKVKPDACLLMEAEIWPEHLHQARLRGVPVLLINARMSERSFARWRRMPRSVLQVFGMLHRVVAASEEDRRRYVHLGLPADRVLVSGNLKLDFDPSPLLNEQDIEGLRRELGFFDPQDRTARPPVLAGASTWPGEEAMLLRVWEGLREQGLSCRLLLIPRHAERRQELRAELARTDWTVHFRSGGAASGSVDVTVADTTGEMVRLLQVADVVFVGKSMAPHQGGQNPIEAAALGRAVLFGPNMQNFQAVARSMLEHGAALETRNERQLLLEAARLLHDPSARDSQARAAQQWHRAGRGATERTFAVLKEALGEGEGVRGKREGVRGKR